jgi:hypothetical protein
MCARSDCNSPAAAILTYDREAQTAYLYTVDDPSTRSPGDLCDRHLRRLVLPRSWSLDDRRETSAETNAPRTGAGRSEKARAARRAPARRKWAEVGPSLFDAPANDVASRPGARDDRADATEPGWMPRFGPETDLDDVLDPETPLLRRAFGGS